MKKTRNLVAGLILLLGGISLALLSNEGGSLSSPMITPKTRGITFTICFAWWWMLFSFFNPHSKEIEKDELTKKIGYTSYALSAQIICLLWWLAFVIDLLFPFLEKYTAFDALILIIDGMLITTFFAWLYYSKHPDKTWL